MNSKECLKHICDECQKNAGKIQVACPFRSISNEYCDEYETIKQSLDRLEQLEKENQELRKAVKSWNENGGKLIRENTKLKKALDILKSAFIIEFKDSQPDYFEKFYTIKLTEYNTIKCESVIGVFEECEKEDYELLKEVLDCD